MPELERASFAQARAHVLVKQGLAGDGLGGVLDAVAATAGIYGTAPTCYLSCAARVRGFRIAELDEKRIAKWSGQSEAEATALADRIEAAMAGKPPLTVRELKELLGGDLPGDKNALQMTVALLCLRA